MMRGLRQSADYILIFQFLILGEIFLTTNTVSQCTAQVLVPVCVCMITAHIILCWCVCVLCVPPPPRTKHPLTAHSRGARWSTPRSARHTTEMRCYPAAAAAGYDYQYCRLLMIILFSASQTDQARRGESACHRALPIGAAGRHINMDIYESAQTQSLDLPTRLDCPLPGPSTAPRPPRAQGVALSYTELALGRSDRPKSVPSDEKHTKSALANIK
jgi:hypothetical protein